MAKAMEARPAAAAPKAMKAMEKAADKAPATAAAPKAMKATKAMKPEKRAIDKAMKVLNFTKAIDKAIEKAMLRNFLRRLKPYLKLLEKVEKFLKLLKAERVPGGDSRAPLARLVSMQQDNVTV